VTKKRIIDKIN